MIRSFSFHTVWHLLWRDDRYEDGTIPEEESEYVFLEPKADNTPSPNSAAKSGSSLIWADTGQPAPRAGRWLVQDDMHASVTLKAGDRLPQHLDRRVRWVLADL